MHRTLRAHWYLTYAVAVAPDGVHCANVDTKFGLARLMQSHGDHIIGYYNGRIDRDDMLSDVIAAAESIGLI